ncbi:MAG: 3-oxoacyl-acyl-carrier-protein synthase I [Bacteroidetes bacterium]|nr:MAG: 3-oxoacyl-acyl-carrier-protein synthase I [Bacteroidota bacterium]
MKEQFKMTGPLKHPINITGTGIVAPIGDNASACFHSLVHGRTGIGRIMHLDTVHREIFPVGEVKHSNASLLSMAGLDERPGKFYTRATLMSVIAIREAIAEAGLTEDELRDCALVSATSVGGMDKTEHCYRNPEYTSLDYVYTHPCGDTADSICDLLGIQGYRTTLSTACSSGANALMHAALLIRNGIADRVIAGGVDPLCLFTLNGFNSLMILDKEHCRPFDSSRNGLNLGEGAGFLVLESDRSVKSRGAKVHCRLTGFSNTNDAFHQTASSPNGEGAYLAMTQALESAGLEPGQIGYINVHGTGTQNNDLSEGIAIRRVFGEKVPPFSSTKSLTGHALGAAAALEAVFSVLALTNDTLLPQIGFNAPVEETGLIPVTRATKAELSHVLSNSFGFGGNNSTLIFSKQDGTLL